MIQNNRDDDLHESVLPVVPFVPYRCPACKRHRVKTSNTRGRIRQHLCLACGMKYRSLELDPAEAVDWGFAVPPPPEA